MAVQNCRTKAQSVLQPGRTPVRLPYALPSAFYWASSPEAMTDDERRRWKERYRNASVENLQASLANASPEHRRLINELIDEIRRAADAPHLRRHRELIWCTLIAAVIGALIGAAATAWFS